MNIQVDATPLLLRSAGVKNYLWHWIRAMRAQAGPHSISAFPLIRDTGTLHHDSSVLDAFPTLTRLALVGFLNLPHNPAARLASAGCDVFHASNMVRNPPSGCKLTATIHDMTSALMPQFHTESSVRADRYYADRILRRADALIAVSESTKADAVRLLRLPPERVTVIYSGVDARFFIAKPAPAPQPYVLFLSTIEPRKNVDLLLDAWDRLPTDIREAHDLVLAGPVGWRSDATMARIRAISRGVRHIGYVSESDLPGLVAGSTAFVYPSLYEGFGFPPLQAMAAGSAHHYLECVFPSRGRGRRCTADRSAQRRRTFIGDRARPRFAFAAVRPGGKRAPSGSPLLVGALRKGVASLLRESVLV